MRVIFCTFIFLFMCIVPAYATKDDEMQEMRNEIDELKKEFAAMKQHYTAKITELEFKLSESSVSALPRSSYKAQANSQTTYSHTSAIMNPDISVIANVKQRFNDDVSDDNRHKLTVGEAELTMSGMIYPNIRGDATVAVENEYSGESDTNTETDLEEAYISFLALPFNSQVLIGRKLIDFGLINPQHPHEWAFSDTPLVLENLFGDHPWYDDGIQGSILVPNPLDVYWETKFGVWNGRSLAHSHDHSEDEEHIHGALENEPVNWGDIVFTARSYWNVPVGDNADIGFGYSAAWDEHPMTVLHGFDFTTRYRFPNKYNWIKWQTEYILADVEAERLHEAHHHDEEEEEEAHAPEIYDYIANGMYSMLEYSINKYWRVGTRWDYAEYNEHERYYQWANSYFLTYFFNHNLYARMEYRYRDYAGLEDGHQEPENTIWFQLVWGLGPHGHGIAE
ncbi:MAG: hypothetical protein C4541_01195 [Candidatus Auribacter fodinae]|uniref:DUF3570 domain-containing protein n=1 Tax=Candidatus Auribacter fodinae TaxID=2093366 RepID=A0A3A4R9D7_9BACT|nr:MAG: hypothetical protein C4541_01195 [Candidatus Auribacter fodinae]